MKRALADKLRQKHSYFQQHPREAPTCFIGFDGFTDEIVSVVQTRSNPKKFTPFATIKEFGQRIQSAAGQSCNFELVIKQKKLGGNAPIMANALLEGGHPVIFAGTIGTKEEIEPLFQPMASRCMAVVPLGPSAHSDALEFHDGKIILGKLATLDGVTYDHIINEIGKKQLVAWLDKSELFACVNWTMLPMMTELWERLAEEIVPSLQRRDRILFVDLADPAKRTDGDLARAMKALGTLKGHYRVILGLNKAEALRLGSVFQLTVKGHDSEGIKRLAADLRSTIGCHQVVIHPTAFAVAASENDVWAVEGPFCPKPILTTGAGDNFNAGYCTGCLYGFTPQECLLTGVATSGYYVSHGHSPSMAQLTEFLTQWK